jgi:hypothetical protein
VTDQEPLEGAGLFTRLGLGKKSGALSFSALEEIFAPSRHEARQEIEQQRRVGRPTAAPTDPLEPEPEPERPGSGRFSGTVVIRKT